MIELVHTQVQCAFLFAVSCAVKYAAEQLIATRADALHADAETRADALNEVTESGRRLTRSKLLAKRPHSGGHRPGKKLHNVGEISGRPPEDLGKTSDLSVKFW